MRRSGGRGTMPAAILAGLALLLAGGRPALGSAGAVPGVVAQTRVAVAGARLLGLSPDGHWLLGVREDPERLCSFDAATQAERACVDLRARGYRGTIYAESVAWAPDGGRIAFTENALQFLYESDIWLFDLARGTLTDLTDDGASGSLLRPERLGPRFDVDLWPAWSPDGRAIAFARGARENGTAGEVGIYRVGADGGAPTLVRSLPTQNVFDVYPTLRWTAEGRLVYSLLRAGEDAASRLLVNGLYAIAADGTAGGKVAADGARGTPLLVDAAAGNRALVISSEALKTVGSGRPATAAYATVDLTTGKETPLVALDATLWPWKTMALVTLSPDGAALLSVGRPQPGGDPRQRPLRLIDLATGRATTLLDRIDAWLGGREPLGLSWTAGGLVYVPGSNGDGTLLRLADGIATPVATHSMPG